MARGTTSPSARSPPTGWGLPIDDISWSKGDTDHIPFGNGTWGARSTSVAGTAIYRAADKVIAKARALRRRSAGMRGGRYRLSTAARFSVRGTDRSIGFAEVADVAYHGAQLPADGSLEPGLEVTEFYDPPDTNDPQAMHLAVVIVDADTGAVTLRALYAADDCGMIDQSDDRRGPGAWRLGAGHRPGADGTDRLRSRSGQLLTGSFMDYAHAAGRAILPSFRTAFIATPAPSNPLGVKGGSESGTIGAPAAIGNAVIDALWHLGVRDITLPITPETVWRALREAHPGTARATDA